jgi:hypothetical protein
MATYLSKAMRIQLRASCLIAASFAAIWIGGATSVRAQNYQAGGYFTAVIPHGEFHENITNNGYGAGGYFLVRLGSSPFLAGGDIGIVVYGSESRDEPFSLTIPEVSVSVRTSNNILLAHSILRIQPREGRIRPYADGLIGLKHLFTRTSICCQFDGEEIAGTTNLSDTTFSYGAGVGVQVPILRKAGLDISLDGNVRYLRGAWGEYLKKGSIRQDNGGLSYDIFSSRTDVIAVQIGVAFSF